MPQLPAVPDPGPDDGPGRIPGLPEWRRVPDRPEGADIPEDVRQAWREAEAADGEPEDAEWYADPDEEDLEEITAQCRAIAAGRAWEYAREAELGTLAAVAAAEAARRGPGMPGSARRAPGEYTTRAAQFAAGMMMDVMPGCAELAGFADEAAGPDDCFDGASDDELAGVVCAWDRVAAHAAARKLAAVAEVFRRRPEPGCGPAGPARMPEACEEFAAEELAHLLAVSRGEADRLLCVAYDLTVKLPATRAALRDGIVSEEKADIIARATQPLTPQEARAAEALVLDRAGRLTPGGLRAAIARAVMQVAPDKARKRREEAARDARVQRWAEDSGNAALAGRELPPAEVLAADQRVSWWARQLRAAGLDGDMDQLRARAYLDILLDRDSRPRPGDGGPADSDERPGPGPGAGADPAAGALPAGFAGRVNLTVPVATVLGLAARPGEIPGIGPIDPWLARDLAAAAARNPKTTWCVTVTDQDGHAIGHGCARPEPKNDHEKGAKPGKPDAPGGHDPPAGGGERDGPGFAFTAAGGPGLPGGYGTWRLATGTPGRPDLLVSLDPIATDECDHRFEARGHDPGVKLRHLTQIRHATCTAPACRRPAANCDFEHNVPYDAGGRTCMCNGGPKCRRDHRLKQHPRWKVEQVTPGTVRWTAPSGRQFTTEPTRYPI